MLEKKDIIKIKNALKFIRQGKTMLERFNEEKGYDTLTNLTIALNKNIDNILEYIKNNEDNIEEKKILDLLSILNGSIQKIESFSEKKIDQQLTMNFE